MSVTKAPYSEEKINLLKQLLLNSKQSGHPKDYEIKVDEMKVVNRTNDVDLFDSHEEFIGDNTRCVTILVYDGASRNNTKHIFSLQEDKKEEPAPAPTLSGVEIEKRIKAGVDEKVKEVKRELKYEQLEEENEELKEENAGLHEVIDRWRAKYQELEKKKGAENLNWGKFAGGVADTLLKKNLHVIKNVPGLDGLAEALMQGGEEKEELGETEETEVTFSRRNSSENLTERQREHLRILEEMEDGFGEERLNSIMEILILFKENPETIEPAKDFIKEYKNEPAAQQEEKKSQPAKQGIEKEATEEKKQSPENNGEKQETKEQEVQENKAEQPGATENKVLTQEEIDDALPENSTF